MDGAAGRSLSVRNGWGSAGCVADEWRWRNGSAVGARAGLREPGWKQGEQAREWEVNVLVVDLDRCPSSPGGEAVIYSRLSTGLLIENLTGDGGCSVSSQRKISRGVTPSCSVSNTIRPFPVG